MNVAGKVEEVNILIVADVESGHRISVCRSTAGDHREILVLPVRAVSIKDLVHVTGVDVCIEDVNCGRRGEGNQLAGGLWTSDYFRQVGIDPLTVVV